MGLKVKLISVPGLDPLIPRILYLPLGIATVSARLKQGGYVVAKEDLNALPDDTASPLFHLQNLFTILRMRNPALLSEHLFLQKRHPEFDEYVSRTVVTGDYGDDDVIGLSALSHEAFLFALLLAGCLKKRYPGKTLVLGGAYLSIAGNHLLDKLPYVDFLARGRGDISMLQLLEHLSLGKGSIERIGGLEYRNARGRVQVNPVRESDLEEEPVPDFDGFDFDRYRGYIQPELGEEGYGFSIPYRTSIGCVRRCNFCDYRCVQGVYREKSVGKAVTEIALLARRYDTPYIHIVDSAMDNNPANLRAFCIRLIEEKLHLRWHGYMRAAGASRELLGLMRRAGAFSLRWGIESGSSEVLRYIGKGYTRDQAVAALDAAGELGFRSTILMIIGEPYERLPQVEDTLSFLERFIPDGNVNQLVYSLKLISHSPLFLEPEKFGIRILMPDERRSGLLTFSRLGYGFDETNGLPWRKRRALTARLLRYAMIRIERAEKRAGKKKTCFPRLSVWRRLLLERSYVLRYLKTLVAGRPVKYVT